MNTLFNRCAARHLLAAALSALLLVTNTPAIDADAAPSVAATAGHTAGAERRHPAAAGPVVR